MTTRTGILPAVLRYSDIAVAVVVLLVVAMMIVPVPPGLMDVLLVFNLTFATVVMLVSMYTTEPLDFSIFPSLLLLTTLMRLALNVSSTRLILLHAYAGEVIEQFGHFVVGGNPVVGFVVFVILVVIQFVVITRGAERVAEVAARFTLDAMPGKQMSIDADLNAGLIDDEGARARRREIEREADFYGAMDGASKFVKGDAIAAIIITIINIIGGLVVGVLQMNLPFGEALMSYTLLTVGDGLVSQLPALLISVATGIVVTRAASDVDLGNDLVAQLLQKPRVLYIAAAMLLALGIVPGLPAFPFFILAGLAVFVGRNLAPAPAAGEEPEVEAPEERVRPQGPEEMARMLQVDPVAVELGYGLLPLAEKGEGNDLMERIGLLRRQLAMELGMVLPLVRLRDNMALDANAYAVKLRGVVVARGELMVDRYLAMDPGDAAEELPGIETVEPAFGLPARWIAAADRDRAEMGGYTVVDPASVLMTHLAEVLKSHAHELLSRQETKIILDAVKETSPAVVEELVPETMSLGDVQKVLQNLLRERIPIRDLLTIFETMADYASAVRDTDRLSEVVRQSLYRTVSQLVPTQDGRLRVILLDPTVEEVITESLEHTEGGTFVALDPDRQSAMIRSARRAAEKGLEMGVEPVVLCSPAVRFYFKRITEQAMPELTVVSFQEIEPSIEIEAIGKVDME
ncbi:MAG: flagellar biosynthesis protein FlhA [Bacillota bacterium]